jgi:hypothetical protein
MDKTIIEYYIPIQSEERVTESNKKYKEAFGNDFEPFKSTEEHINILLDNLLETICKVGDAGGWYWGDDIKVKIELEYEPEDK